MRPAHKVATDAPSITEVLCGPPKNPEDGNEPWRLQAEGDNQMYISSETCASI